MRLLRANTAVVVVVGPFLDKTDGVTIKTSLSPSNERITATIETDDGVAPIAVIPYSAGSTSGSNALNYMATGTGSGLMQLALTAANTNYYGRFFISITDSINHVPVFHEYMIVPATVYDALYKGIANSNSNWQ